MYVLFGEPTLRIQQACHPQVSFSHTEGLFQVLHIGLSVHFAHVDKSGAERTERMTPLSTVIFNMSCPSCWGSEVWSHNHLFTRLCWLAELLTESTCLVSNKPVPAPVFILSSGCLNLSNIRTIYGWNAFGSSSYNQAWRIFSQQPATTWRRRAFMSTESSQRRLCLRITENHLSRINIQCYNLKRPFFHL